MKVFILKKVFGTATLCFLAVILIACSSNQATSISGSAKIPVTTSSQSAREAFDKGQALFDNLQFVQSRSHLERALELDPTFAMAHMLLALSSPSASHFFKSLSDAEVNAGNASQGEQLVIRAFVAQGKNDQTSQLKMLEQLVVLHPRDERAHMFLGNFYNQQQNFDQSVKYFDQAIEIAPSFAGAYNSLGYAHRANENLEQASQAFAKYVKLIPNEANPYDSYAELLLEMGKYKQAIENYKKALVIDPHFGASFAGISIAQSLQNNTLAAQKTTKKMFAAARTPAERMNAKFRSITSYLLADDKKGAMRAAKEMYAIAKIENDHAAMGNIKEYMGDMMLDASKTEKGLKFYSAALEHRQQAKINDANKAQAKRNYLFKAAIAALINKDMKTSISLIAKYTTSVKQEGTSFERRRIHELTGYLAINKNDGVVAIKELAQGNITNPIVLYWSAVAYNMSGDKETAIKLANKAAKRNTLSGNMPFARSRALILLDKLSKS